MTLQISVPLANLLRRPDGPRDRQLLMGDTVEVLNSENGWSEVRSEKDSYHGFVKSDALSTSHAVTHHVCVPSTHVYPKPDMKSAETMSLSFGCKLEVTGEEGAFLRTPLGYIPMPHLNPLTEFADDPVAVAELFLGTPYLWGGNSRSGIDCSGLVQASLLACGMECPGDSGEQEHALGSALAAGTPPQRGDLLFWKGHVAWVVDPDRILHANAHHMAVQFEPLKQAIERIQQQGDGPVTSHRRLRGISPA